ncbi:hypothetical protein [Frateuria soli]|nr:hypothetical protein [Frateuria soli]UGB37666.1 hypothetical protein LQ771_12650 [Frateuria soli]
MDDLFAAADAGRQARIAVAGRKQGDGALITILFPPIRGRFSRVRLR